MRQGPVFSAYSQVAGVVLAAGGSKRLGQPKQLLDWQGEPFISKIVKTGLGKRPDAAGGGYGSGEGIN